MRILLQVLALLVLLTACAAEASRTGSSAPTTDEGGTATTENENELRVELDRGDGSAVARYTLVCDGVAGGDHPAAQEACDHLRAMADPFAPIPADAICSQVYDGPQTAHVTGRWRGEPVDLQLSRNNSCRTAQWDGLGPLLPG